MLKATKELIKIVETRASEQNSSTEAHELLQQGADITASTNNGSMIYSVIAEEKRYRLAIPWRANNCQNLIQVLQRGATDRLSLQVFSVNGGDLKNMHTLVQLKASCHQATKYGPLGLLGSLLRQDEIPVRLDVVRFLIENDPDVKHSLTAVDDQQQTNLYLAKNNGKCPSEVVDYLQEQFDDIITQIPFTQPEIDPIEVTMWIHRGANMEAIDKNSNTALSNAVIADNLKLVRVLVSAGSNTAHRNVDGLTPLQIAQRAISRNPPLIAILETQHVNAELKCLIEAKQSQLTVEEVRILLENGADINAATTNNNSFLHLLIGNKGTPEMMTTFVNDFNANLSATNTSGYRPIELCVQFDEDSLIYLPTLFKLPKMTSDLFNNSKLNQTLLRFALDTQRFEAAKVIQNELNHRLWDCAMRSINAKDFDHDTTLAELKTLVTCGAQIDCKSPQEAHTERTILHMACEMGIEQLVEYTVKELQADYTLQNCDGNYPISIAAENGHLLIVKYLCGLPNSTLNRFNKDRQTPLHLAAKKHHLSIVQYLVLWGADHKAQNLLEQTPLDVARTHGFKNKEEEIRNKKIILFFEQLLCPPVNDALQQSANSTQPSGDLDTCDPVTPAVVNPIHTDSDDEEEILGKQWKGLFSGSPNNSLHEAAKNGSVWEAQKAIGQGADIRHRKKNHTAYEVAILSEKEYRHHLQSTKLIVVDRSMLETMMTGCQEIASMIQRIAQIKLVEAIDQSNPSKVMSYHIAGASLSADLLYRTCNISDNVKIVDYLLNQDEDIYQTLINDVSSNCPYRIAKTKNFIQLAHYLRYRLSVECAKAVRENNLAMVKNLVHAGASVNIRDTNNLNEALEHQNADLIQFLCEHGVAMPSEWMTAENIVLDPVLAQQMKPEIVHRINQCLINRRLRSAAANGDLDSVIHCHRLSADINSVNCHGSTALLYAIQYGNYFPIVHTLVSCGASILHSNEDEPTSLVDLAKRKGYKQIVDYLSKELNSQFLSAIANNHRQVAEKLAQMGVDFNYQDEQKRTALHYAVEYHGADLVNWLCECGSTPTICDINGDYPIIQATQKGDYAVVELFVTKYPACKRHTNKAGLTALQIAQQLKFTRIAELIETGKTMSQSLNDHSGEPEQPKHGFATLMQASRDGHIKTIQEFIDQRYESKEQKRQLCFELIQVAKQAKQRQISDLLEPYYKTKLKTELASDMELGGIGFTLSEHHKRVLRGFLSGLSTLIADSPIVLDPTDPKTYVDLFSALTSNIAKRSQELQQVTNEHDVRKIIEQDEINTKQQLTKISEQLEQLLESRDSLQARIQDTDERLFKQQNLTAIQRKEFMKEKEIHKQQLAIYECSIFLFQRQQEATLTRQKTVDFIKGNANLIMFYRTIENRLEALFHSALAAQGGYLKKETTAKFGMTSPVFTMWPTKLPILSLASTSIKTVLGPVLSKLNEKEQKKEWHNISTLGNIEELRRIASDTAGLLTLYYREQIQSIDSSQKIKGNNVINDTIHSLKQVCDVRPESSEEMAVVIVAEYVTTWIIDELKLGREKIDPAEPLPQQLWLCVARKDPICQGKAVKLVDSVGISTGQQKITLKLNNFFGEETTIAVQLRYLIGCVSVVGNDGSIYQYSVSQNELNDLDIFGYVYVTPFSSDEKALQSIVEGRKLNLAKRDEQGNILTRFEDIIEHAQTYAIQNDQYQSKLLIVQETANQVAGILREQKIFVDANSMQEELRKVQATIELSVDVLREDIQEKTKFYQTSIDATHDQIKRESEENRQTMKIDNEIRYEKAADQLSEKVKEMQKSLEQMVDTRMNNIEHYMQEKSRLISAMAEAAEVQSLKAVAQANQATQINQVLLEQATQAANSVQYLVQWAQRQHEEFQIAIERCQTTTQQAALFQKESSERIISEMRVKIEQDCERARQAAHESAQLAQQTVSKTLDLKRILESQLELQTKETKRNIGEAQRARQQAERAIIEVRAAEEHTRRAANSSVAALEKVNNIHRKVERTLEQLERLSKKVESKPPSVVF